MPRHASWSPEQKQQVGLWLAAGRSLGGIARSLGSTRGTVVGRIYRDKELRSHVSKGQVVRLIGKVMSPHRHPVGTIACVVAEPPELPDLTVEQACGFMLAELPAGTCRWPIAETHYGHLFCGAQTHPGIVYCPRHQRQAHP